MKLPIIYEDLGLWRLSCLRSSSYVTLLAQAQNKIAEYEINYEYARAQRSAIEALEAEAIAQQQAEKDAVAQRVLAAEEPEIVMPMVESEGGYVSGTCKELAARGIGSDFRPEDANHTSARDRDGDGIACES